MPKSRVKIDRRQWNHTLRPILDGLRDDLGLPDGSRLTAELHSVLVYTPGQFFLPHQDSEKSDAHGRRTLTVTLPGRRTGGELVIDHAGEQVTYRVVGRRCCRSSRSTPTAGTRSRRSGRGYRVVLTYNLLAAAETPPSGGAPATDAE